MCVVPSGSIDANKQAYPFLCLEILVHFVLLKTNVTGTAATSIATRLTICQTRRNRLGGPSFEGTVAGSASS